MEIHRILYPILMVVLLFRRTTATDRTLDEVRVKTPGPETDFCDKYIRILNFECVEYSVVSDDGFVLRLQRVSWPRARQDGEDRTSGGEKDGDGRKGIQVPILLEHGLFLGGDIWFNLLTEKITDKNLPFVLAYNGFDVWIGNHRGTRSSYENVYHASDTRAFWDWSFEELASYDLPAMIKLVQRETQSPKIHLVGYDQGGMLPIILASTNPDMADAIESLVLISPIVYFINITSPTIYNWATRFTPDELVYLLNINNAQFNLTVVESFLGIFSNLGLNLASYIAVGNGENEIIGNVTGPSCCLEQPPSVAVSKIDTNWVVGSYRLLIHYQQEIRAQEFQRYDFMNPISNYVAYSNPTPPKYQPELVPDHIPIMVLNGGNDWMADEQNINRLLSKFKGRVNHLFLPEYSHSDMVYSKRATEDVFLPIVKYLKEGYYGDAH